VGKSGTRAMKPQTRTRATASGRRQELILREENFRTIFDNSAVAITVADENERIVFWNKHAEDLLGMTRDDLNMRPVASLYPEEEWKSIRARNIRRKGIQHQIETRIASKNGDLKDVTLSLSVLKDSDGRVTGSIGMMADITDRRKLQEQLQQVKEKYSTLFENTAIAITIADESERVISWNKCAEILLGMGREELFMRPVRSLYPAREWRKIRAQNIRQKGMEHHLETKILRRGGGTMDVDLSLSVLKGPGGKVIGSIGIMADISQRKKVEEQLWLVQQNYRTLFDNTAVAITIADENEAIVSWNRYAETLLGMTTEQLYMKPVRSLYPEKEWAKIKSQNLRQRGLHHHLETRIVTERGNEIDVDLSISILKGHDGEVTGSIGVMADITERKRAEEGLREAERRYRAIFDNPLHMVYVYDSSGVFLDANEKALNSLGYAREEMAAINALEVLHPADVPRALESFEELMANGFRDRPLEIRVITRAGETIWIEASASLLYLDAERAVFLGIAHDITERKWAEQALQESEREYSVLVGNLADAVFRFRDGAITWANDRIYDMLGYDTEEVIGADVGMFVAGEGRLSEVYRQVDAGLKDRGHFHGVTKVTRKDGTVLDVEYTASLVPGTDPIELVGAARDITERRRMEEALRRSQEDFRRLVESLNDSIVVVDAETMSVAFCNQRAARLYGFDSTDAFIGSNALELVHPDDRQEVVRAFLQDVYEKERRQRYELRAVRRDGAEVYVSALATRIEFGDRTAVFLSVRDLTELRKAEEEKARMEQQLQLSGRLAAVGQLSAGVAHELNNPLAAVRAYAQFLAAREDLDESVRRDVETIFRETQRACHITTNLLSFARKHEPDRTSICINEVVKESLELHAYRLRVNNVEVVTDLDPDIPCTMADFYQMQQVFVNLIVNAEQAMTGANGGGTLKIKTEQRGGKVCATFSDNGPGIPEESLTRVFDPFFTTKDVGQGTGLGLSICYGILEAHGGRLYATSNPGQGATFIVELPIVNESQPAAELTGTTEAA
jgi:two-component system NtrC family sensor kinase